MMSPENKIEDRTPMALLPYQQRRMLQKGQLGKQMI